MYGNILDSKKAFLDYKNKELKSPKVSISSKGLVHGPARFWSKNSNFFRLFISGKKKQRKCVWRFSRTNKQLSRL